MNEIFSQTEKSLASWEIQIHVNLVRVKVVLLNKLAKKYRSSKPWEGFLVVAEFFQAVAEDFPVPALP